MNENVHRFAIRGKLLEREIERKNEIKRQRKRGKIERKSNK